VGRIERHFIQRNLIRTMIDEYLAQNFYEAGYSHSVILQSGLGTRIHIYAERPALIIGRRGSTIRRLQKVFSEVMGLGNVQISVSQPDNPELNARVQAFRIVRSIERGYHFRRVAFAALRRIMANGAVGVEKKKNNQKDKKELHFLQVQDVFGVLELSNFSKNTKSDSMKLMLQKIKKQQMIVKNIQVVAEFL
jgi:small subunit ribosomal protein S3